MIQRLKRLAAALTRAGGQGEPDLVLPVVLISFNRGPMMRKVVEGYRRQTVPVEIFVHDNGSDDPETVEVLDELERSGVTVFRREKISSAAELNLVDESVQAIFRDRPASPYAVSDCDVSIGESATDTLEVYLAVLDAMPTMECVGPMLRIDDVPTTYPLYSAMMNRHIGRFWSREPKLTTIAGRRVAYQEAPIDTTLAVYRAGEPYRRLAQGVRLYHPYDARHLDWYPDEHQVAYRRSADGSTISNWSNPARERVNRFVPLEQVSYRAVEPGADGDLVVETRSVAPLSAVPSEAIQSVMERVGAAVEDAWPGRVTRVWVWRDSVGVVEVQGDDEARYGLDLIPGPSEQWAAFVVARTDEADDRLRAIGLEGGSRRRYLVQELAAEPGSAPGADALVEAFRQVLPQLFAADSAVDPAAEPVDEPAADPVVEQPER
ncbi:glycosyltransferase family 2 protein [Cellulomonas edaphi]|uniref:Glycosyltransferase n=1 Tax=Cellulomonas edaphi TaxID=3053468 RepID=A0ABT7S819_9CELL|nr:glycosyltransferase [Cellulomons edaphi]MDM7831752.1 glycosyltransferase [Cellulomons edaphi]